MNIYLQNDRHIIPTHDNTESNKLKFQRLLCGNYGKVASTMFLPPSRQHTHTHTQVAGVPLSHQVISHLHEGRQRDTSQPA